MDRRGKEAAAAGLGDARALTNAKVRRAMRAKFGRVAVVLLFVLSFCGCKSGSNMFASWGKKKPASTLSEAPAYKSSNPALPSAGQIPASIASTPGTSLSASATASTGTATPSSAAAGGYSAMPAGYQQTPYPTTPFGATKVGAVPGAPPTSSMASAPPSSSPAMASASAGAPATGYAAAVGTGNAIPPATGYKFGAASASNSLQPQNGFYNPAYGGTGSSSTPPSYAATASANPAYNYNTPAAASPSATAPGSQIRVADVRGGATVAPSAQVAMTGAAPTAAVVNNSAMTGAPSQGSSSAVGDRYSNFATGGPTATTVAAPVASAPPVAAAAAPSNVDTRAMPATSNENYRPSAEASGSDAAPEAAASPAAPAANPAPVESPLRKDPGYRPGGTSDYAPGGNTLRPGTSDGNGQSNSQPASKSVGGVTQASYQTPAASAPPLTLASASGASGDRYKDFQAAPSAEPAYGASSPAPLQQGAYPDHSW